MNTEPKKDELMECKDCIECATQGFCGIPKHLMDRCLVTKEYFRRMPVTPQQSYEEWVLQKMKEWDKDFKFENIACPNVRKWIENSLREKAKIEVMR